MDLKERKINFIRTFFLLEDEKVIAHLEQLLYAETRKYNPGFTPMSLEEFHDRIEKSMNDSKDDKLTEVDELIAEVSKWG